MTRRAAAVFAAGVIPLAGLLTWASIGGWDVRVWFSFALALTLAGGGLLALERWLPRWVWLLTLGAALLRLGLGAFWVQALPRWGYGTEVEQAGYVMSDAHDRDLAAWELARSDMPLGAAFHGYDHSDQYGGMLFLSAATYRYLNWSPRHLPLLVVVFTATTSATAVALAWAIGRLWRGADVARWAAWGIALYPEAVLLGSTQMREAFTVPLAAAALLALAAWDQARSRRAGLALISALLGMAFFTPPMAVVTAGLLAVVAIGLSRRWRWDRRTALLALGLFVLLMVLGALSIRLVIPDRGGLLASIRWWLKEVFRYQTVLAKWSSDWIRRILKNSPTWFHMPFLMTYGVLRPFLPAALIARGAPVWWGIAIGRALGWTVVLAGLVYAPIGARLDRRRTLLWGLWLAVLLGMLVADYRGAADQWDNPRYRATWAVWQVVLVAWVWVSARQHRDPWLRRLIGGVAALFFWFLPWYLSRYTAFPWPEWDPFRPAALGLVSALMFALWDWARSHP